MFSTISPPTEKDLSTLLTPEQYCNLFCSVHTLPEVPEDSEPNIRVADKLSSTEERDRLLTRRTHHPSVQGNSLESVSKKSPSMTRRADNMGLPNAPAR